MHALALAVVAGAAAALLPLAPASAYCDDSPANPCRTVCDDVADAVPPYRDIFMCPQN